MIFNRLWPRVAIVALLGAAIPLGVASWMLAGLTRKGEEMSRRQLQDLAVPLEQAEHALAAAILTHKGAVGDVARALAGRPSLAAACADPTTAPAALAAIVPDAGPVTAIALEQGVAVLAEAKGTGTGPARRVTAPVPGARGCTFVLSATAPAGLLEEHERLAELVRRHRDLPRAAEAFALPAAYSRALLGGLAGGVLVSVGLALWLGVDLTRRTRRLARAAAQVGEGRLDVVVAPRETDELGDLGRAFDQMVRDLARSRDEIAYLQTISAWQEVARRLAHEIKNPLTPIQLAFQELAARYEASSATDPAYTKLLDRVRGIVEREVGGLRRLVDEFHDFARLPTAVLEPLDLAAVVDDARVDVPALTVDVDAPAVPVLVRADRQLFRRVLANLLANAAEAGAKRARVAWRLEGATVHLDVDDDGPGVPDELRAKIFDPYVTARRGGGGTGLGLAIVKKTILEHRGTVEVAAARAPLGGARIRIELPTT